MLYQLRFKEKRLEECIPPPPEESGAVVESPARKNAAGFLRGLCGGDGKEEVRADSERRVMS